MTAPGGIVAQHGMSAFSGFATTGDSDASPNNTASQFLIVRGLEPGVTEQLLANGVAKLYKSKDTLPDPTSAKKRQVASTRNDKKLGANEGSLQRVLLVRDRKSNDSWRYGFAEFSTVEDAQGAMRKFESLDKFTISSKPVTVSYIHAGVFVPVLQAPGPAYERFVFSPLHNPAIKLMYWDEAGYVNVLAVAKEKTALELSKERLAAKMSAAVASGGFVKDDGKTKKRKAEKEAAPAPKKVVAPQLQFWSNRHAELHGILAKEEENVDSTSSKAKQEVRDEDTPPSRSFADMNRKCCLLCARQFKTQAEVNKHERASQLHRENMKNESMVAKAIAKLEKAGILQTSEDVDSAAYRDRAKERRQAFNQPKQPTMQHSKSGKDKEVVEVEEDKPVQSKGAALLGKMGWTEGSGLGAQGTGRTEAISTELYAQGVGLGAEGGKVGDAIAEANRSTQGNYGAFVQKSRDKAKERYEKME